MLPLPSRAALLPAASLALCSSPLAADGRICVVTRRSGTFVLDAKPEFRQLARRQLASDSSDLNASPAVCGGRIYPRSDERLCCAGAAKS